MRSFLTRNPFSGELRESVPFITDSKLSIKLSLAKQASSIQLSRTLKERAGLIKALEGILEQYKSKTAEMISFETGSPLTSSEHSVKTCINLCRYYVKNYQQVLTPLNVKTTGRKTLVKYQPLGTIYVISPSLEELMRVFIPNFLLGNCLLARMDEATPALAKWIETMMSRAGIQGGEYQNVFSSHSQIEHILADTAIAGVHFTGWIQTGKSIAALAGKHLKVASILTHSQNTMIVCPDANLDLTMACIERNRLYSPSYTALKNIIFIDKNESYATFKGMLRKLAQEVIYGDPMKPSTTMGIMANEETKKDFLTAVHSLPSHEKILFRDSSIQKPFTPLTIIESERVVESESVVVGPVLKLRCVKGEKEAVDWANRCGGVSCSVMSEGVGGQILQGVRCGVGFVNEQGRACSTGEEWRLFANVRTHYVGW